MADDENECQFTGLLPLFILTYIVFFYWKQLETNKFKYFISIVVAFDET